MRILKLTYCLTVLFPFVFQNGLGQNLVPNGSFENYSSCPDDFSQLPKAIGWNQPTHGTPDYFDSCSINALVRVPLNFGGYQFAHTGGGYAGIHITNGPNDPWREYLQIALTVPLIAGRSYNFEMYLSLADSSGLASNKIGVCFLNNAISSSITSALSITPQIVSSTYITDKVNWTRVSAIYTATGGEHYIIIGNFNPPGIDNTTVPVAGGAVLPNYGANWPNNAYYFIDDVYLSNCATALPDFLGNDSDFCGNSITPIKIDASKVNFKNYLWNTGSTSSSIYVNTPGLYWVKAFGDSGCQVYADTINITRTSPPTINLGNDTVLCPNSTFLLKPIHTAGINFRWQDNSSDSFMLVAQTGTYWVKVSTPFGCTSTDSVKINSVFPSIVLGDDINVCDSSVFPIKLSASSANANFYLWSNNSTDSVMNINSPGNYWVRVTKSNCSINDTIRVLNESPPLVNLGTDKVTCLGNVVTISSPNFDSYRWFKTIDLVNPNFSLISSLQSINIFNPGYYVLVLNKNACYRSDTIKIDFKAKPSINLGTDTIICKTIPINYHLNYPGAKYLWNTGDTNSFLTVNNSGMFWGEINNSGCHVRDTVNVLVSPLSPFSFGSDTSLCNGQSIVLNASATGATSYKWNTNSTAQILNVNSPGLYWAEAKDAKCKVRDSILISFAPNPIVNLGNDTTLCAGNTFIINAGNAGAKYFWNTTDTTQTIAITKMGLYSVKVTKNNCSTFDSLILTIQNPPSLNIGNDTTICEGSSLLLNASSPGSKYKWQDGSISSKFLAANQGKYLVTVTNGFCKLSDSINLYIQVKPNLNIGQDSSFCFDLSILLDASMSAAEKYLWQDGSTSNSYLANSAGTYWVEIKKAFCSVRDSVTLTQKPLPVIDLGADKKLCKENFQTLVAANPGSTYLWNDQSTLPSRIVKAPGLFFVKVTNQYGCFVVDSILLDTFRSPIVSLGKDTSFCEGQTYQLIAGTQFKSYLWQDASTGNFIIAKNAGIYSVMIQDFNNCSASDSIQISINPKPVINIKSLIKVCEPDMIIKPSGNFISYLWHDGTTSSSFHISDYGNYSLTVTDSNYCSGTKQIEVTSSCPGSLYVPNAFTPNSDGRNETFYPVVRNIKSLHFEIYNRWGEKVFETDEINKGWDGKYQNNISEPDVYVYKIIYTGLNEEMNILKGNVTLIR